MTTLKTLTPDPTSPTEPTAGGTESLGAWLAQVRNSFNAEQREVARHLGLNAAIIEALESDHFERLGAPVFVRGYLSRYARLLNLPEQAVLERYRRQADAVHQEPPPLKVMHPMRRQTRVRDLRGVFYLMVVVAIAWAAIQNLESLDPTRLFARWSGDAPSAAPSTDADSAPGGAISQTQYPFQQAPSEPAAAAPTSTTVSAPAPRASEEPPPVAAAPAPAEPAPPAASPASPAPSVAVAPPALTPAPISTTGLTATVVSASPGATPTSLAAGPVSGEAKLLLEFSNDCWVEVKDAQGNVLVNGLMKADSTRTLSGAAPFKVTLGNAPATRIKLDDRLVDTDFYVPRRGTVSRFTLARDQQ